MNRRLWWMEPGGSRDSANRQRTGAQSGRDAVSGVANQL
jgi:hypothetical protein